MHISDLVLQSRRGHCWGYKHRKAAEWRYLVRGLMIIIESLWFHRKLSVRSISISTGSHEDYGTRDSDRCRRRPTLGSLESGEANKSSLRGAGAPASGIQRGHTRYRQYCLGTKGAIADVKREGVSAVCEREAHRPTGSPELDSRTNPKSD